MGIGQRLKQLRLARGLSLDGLAAELGSAVTKQALSKYELDKAHPSPSVLTKLASVLGVKAVHLITEPAYRVEFIAYRKGSGLLKSQQARIKGMVCEALERRIRLQKLIQIVNGPDIGVQAVPVHTMQDAENAADNLRLQWNLGLCPVASVTGLLEDHCIHVIEIEAGERFDGISAVAYDEEGRIVAAAVVTRRGVCGERQRLSLIHELAHLILKVSPEVDEEAAAFRFAGAFLAPADALFRDVGRQRRFIEGSELLLLKRRYGLSLQALLHRLHDLGIITASYYKQWSIDISRLGWRKKEPFESPPEEPQWLRQKVLRSLAEGLLTQDEAKHMLGENVGAETPLSLVERRAFMKLPMEERRRILAEQADKMASLYESDKEWRDIEGGDLIE